MIVRRTPWAALAALSLVAAPVAASAAPASAARTSAPPVEGEGITGHPLAWGMAGLILALTAVLIFEDRGEDTTPYTPVSP